MRMTGAIVLAAVLTTAAVPALAGEWVYHGGPKGPDSLTWYDQDYGYGGYGPYGYGPRAAYYDEGGPYAAGRGWHGPRTYRCGPATVDCFNRSRQLTGTH